MLGLLILPFVYINPIIKKLKRNVVLTNLVITMEKTSNEQNQIKEEVRKQKKRFNRFYKMTPEQQKTAARNLISRSERRNKIKDELIRILSSKENLAITDIQKELGINSRSTFNYWIDIFEREKLIKRETIKCEGKEKRGSPKTLVLNVKLLKERQKYSVEHSKNFEDKSMESYTLRSMFIMNILEEIRNNTSYEQHRELIKLFKQFSKDSSYAAQMTFLLYSDFIKVDYKFSITDKGKKALKKLKKK